MFRKTSFQTIILLASMLALSACSGGGGGGTTPPSVPTYTISGTVSGLAGSGLVLQNNGGDDLGIGADGSFSFAAQVADGSGYAVSVLTHPATPAQFCTVSNSNGIVVGGDVTNISVTCVNTYTVSGTVSGLAGSGLVIQNNSTDNTSITANGSFSFTTKILDGAGYAVSVLAQPSGLSQTCAVTNGSGIIAGADINNVSIVCTTNLYTVSGTVSGLSGSGLVLQNNGADNTSTSVNGTFSFIAQVASGGSYNVSVLTQPSTPSQICAVTGGSGTVTSADITNVNVTCVNTYTVSGTVSGLAGSGLVIQNNSTDNTSITANGSFSFTTKILDGAGYAVSVLTQPSGLSQTCAVTNGSGIIAGADISNVSIVCTTNLYTVSGTVSGLSGSGLVLQNNGADNTSISVNGTFNFTAQVASGGSHNVSVLTQPSTPSQICAVTSSSGTVTSADITNVNVTCLTLYTVGGIVKGLAGSGMVIQNNGTDNTSITANGPFSFTTKILDGASYAVSVLTQPSTPNQSCMINNDAGTVMGGNVLTVEVLCGDYWTWMSGSNSGNQIGVYGVKGTADVANVPGGRMGALSWKDSSNVMWLFGGYGYDSTGTLSELNDLWKFNGSNWIWVSGSNLVNQTGVYGVKGVAAAGNIPGARQGAVSWLDSSNNLWLSGGYGRDVNGTSGHLNDLWKFNGTNWTWVSGSNLVNQLGIYGTQNVAAASNVPGGRAGAISWIDSSNNLWMFGGWGHDSASSSKWYLNDLWKFNGTNWIWVSGSNLSNQAGNYGVKGATSAASVPGARTLTFSWVDSSDVLWLFGGQGVDSAGTSDFLNDLWKFDGANWTWVSGSNIVNQAGVYGTQGTAAASNMPGAREYASTWIDSSNSLWMFGGHGHDSVGTRDNLNDLWKFDGTNWTWVSGSSIADQVGVYGTQGNPAATNVPGARLWGNSWADSNDALWLFGGFGKDSSGATTYLNDLLRYTP